MVQCRLIGPSRGRGQQRCTIRSLFSLILFSIILLSASNEITGKVFMRCELARELLNRQFSKTFLSNWICLIEHESYRDTSKVTVLPNGSKKYGLFQIGSKECRDSSSIASMSCDMKKNPCCKMTCQNFLNDDITDDAECAQKIFNLKGFQYWNGWSNFCRNPQNLPNLSVICNMKSLPPQRVFTSNDNLTSNPLSRLLGKLG